MAVRTTLMPTKIRALLLFGAGAGLLSASPLPAQLVQVRPIADLSLPTRFSLKDGTLHVSQKVGLRFGARMTLIFSDRFDLTNAVSYSPGSATLHGGGKKFEFSSASQSLAAATAARYWVRPPDRPLSWEVHTGVGMVFGGRPSYLDLLDGSTLSAVLGTAVHYQVGRLLSLTLKAQERLLRVQFGEQDGGSARPFQVAFAVGFPFLSLGRNDGTTERP
jgi:hypothetical protein